LLTRCSHGKKEALDLEIGENVRTPSPLFTSYKIRLTVRCPQIKNNLISNIYVINSFLDLIRKGAEKKIIFISSQSGNLDFTRRTGFSTLLGYSVSKAGMNMAVTKFATQLAPEGIKTLALSPGWVNTDAGKSKLNFRRLDRSTDLEQPKP
jgi:NAD(P)-dependent dehydrogenase (short-subunit alcohol dehydrogenase family)